ncbi:MAG: glycosyltransferase family 2 protein [candidate division Zixibacteria bacterium]|nr:glycosyltransferase family 2 protein [candidate division Zixibacteria bacterium]
MPLQNDDLPGISIILALRNEEEHLACCLQSLVDLDYPPDKTEILLVDGMSTDRTAEIIDRWAKADQRIRRLQNPGKIVSTGMNLGLRESRFDLVLWTSGHTLLRPDHLRKCLDTMRRTEAAAVGGVLETVAFSWIGKINAAVLSSSFGVGNARHRIGGQSGWVPAVTMALYRKESILAAGGFNESLPRSQDNDLHNRMNQIGARSYMDAGVRPTYLCRETFWGLLRQAWNNGYWNVMLTKMKSRGLNLRHFVPMAFVLVLLLLTVMAALQPQSGIVLIVFAAIYLAADLVASAFAGIRRSLLWQIPLLFFWFLALHMTYGVASWAALFRRIPAHRAKVRDTDLSS